jgi:8-oxo-dGTP pyrophosphatase MutT (NUDIX family)
MKIPPQAKKVFKGVIFDVYQWEQEMFDGSKTIFERLKRPYTAEVIPVYNGKILIALQEQSAHLLGYSLFGGRVDEGENELSAAKRELLEEAGLASEDWELFETYDTGSKIDWKVYYYIARNCKKIAEQKLDAGEKIEIKAVTFAEFINIVASGETHDHQLVADILRMKLEPSKLEEFKKKLFG